MLDAAIGALELFGIHLGNRLGLYDALLGGASTVDEVATAAGIAPRYAQEWLEQQAVAGVLTVDDVTATPAPAGTPFPSPTWAWWPTRSRSTTWHRWPGSWSASPQLDDVVDAYRTGGGVPCARYGDQFRQGQGASTAGVHVLSRAGVAAGAGAGRRAAGDRRAVGRPGLWPGVVDDRRGPRLPERRGHRRGVMARQGLVARPKRRRRSLTRADKAAPPAPDLLQRHFSAPAINQRWCGDLTEIPTGEGKLYLAAVEDLASRRVPGFAIDERHDAELATGALKMAAAVRGGDVRGVVFHSDRGSGYSAELFKAACRALGVTQSMSRVGSALDNAAAESFFSTLEFECLRKHRFATKADARRAVAAYIDRYNRTRRHSSCEMRSPVDYEEIIAARSAPLARDEEAA